MPPAEESPGSGEAVHILVLHESRGDVLARQHAGMRRYAQSRNWKVHFVRMEKGANLSDILRRFKPSGVIVSLVSPLKRRETGALPVVCFDCPREVVMKGSPYIHHDAEFTAHLVARELFTLKCASYAFAASGEGIGGGIPYWSRTREHFFESEVVSRKGRWAGVFRPLPRRKGGAASAAMRRWLETLPRPCGVFAANDKVAAEVLAAAQRLSLRVPDDVAIVGVDNDLGICTAARPTITSVVPDWEGGGYAAAATLGDMIDNRRVEGERTFRPLGLVRRETTTRTSLPADPRIVHAVDLIRARACTGLKVDDVVAAMRSSRRFAEKYFRDVTGESILEEIRRVRFDKAKVLLSRMSLPLADVVRRCGYSSLPTFCREFKRLSGFSPESWRRKESR